MPKRPRPVSRKSFRESLPQNLPELSQGVVDSLRRYVLPRIPKAQRNEFFLVSLPFTAAEHPTAGQLREVGTSILPRIPRRERARFFFDQLPATLRKRPTPRMLRTVGREILPRIPEESRSLFFLNPLPMSLEHGPTAKQLNKTWRIVADEILPAVPEKHKANFVLNSMASVMRHRPNARQLMAIKRAIEKHGYDPLHAKALADSPNLSRALRLFEKGKFQRLSLENQGQGVTFLGGKNKGIIVKKLDMKGYNAWQKALSSGIPTEPILVRKDGRPRISHTKDGRMMVFTRNLGETLFDFKRRPDYDRYKASVEGQIRGIEEGLARNGINHNDMHPNNITVELIKGKPVVRIIDFHMAEVA